MVPWAKAEDAELSRVRGVCLDIDDTLSTRGKLTSEAYQALWSLKLAGFSVVPITGRPAGWCDHIARFWPVDAVVGENGAFSFFVSAGKRHRIETPGADPDTGNRIFELGQKISARFPHAAWASDQAYREYDLAIDICEDVPTWPGADVDALLQLCEKEGAHAKLSSIHVNAWFGNYDKKAGFRHLLEAGPAAGAPELPSFEQWLFIGDSPNDEPLFEAFPYSVGVANLSAFASRLKHPPRWVTSKESGAGFVEMASRLLAVQK